MTIGMCSPIAVALLKKWLDKSSCELAALMSYNDAPAVTTLADEFLRLGHNLVIFTLDSSVSKQVILRGKNLTIYVAPSSSNNKFKRVVNLLGYNIFLLWQMFKLNKAKIDVMSAHWTRDYAIASANYYRNICPVFVTVRDIMPYILKQNHGLKDYPVYLNYIKNEYVMRMPYINLIANSDYTADMVHRYWRRTISVIYNPIKDEYLTYKRCSEKKCKDNFFKIVSISSSVPDDKRKNIQTLIHAFQLVRSKQKNVQLFLIGQSFISNNNVIKQWNEEGLLEGVVLLGSLSHEKVLKELRESNLMVHPSLEETFGNTLIEAMSCECPVVGGKEAGAVPYVLNQGKAGYLCNVNSAQDIAKTVLEIINFPQNVKAKTLYAKRYCIETFSSKKIAEKYIKLFCIHK